MISTIHQKTIFQNFEKQLLILYYKKNTNMITRWELTIASNPFINLSKRHALNVLDPIYILSWMSHNSLGEQTTQLVHLQGDFTPKPTLPNKILAYDKLRTPHETSVLFK